MTGPRFYRHLYGQIWRSPHYVLVYLDPMICELIPPKSWMSQLTPWRMNKKRAPQSLLEQLSEVLECRSRNDTLSSLLRQGRLGSTPQAERALQMDVAEVLRKYTPEATHFRTVRSVREQSLMLKEVADQPNGESLIVLDAMLARRSAAPTEMQRMFDVLFQDQDSFQHRRIECLLTDVPAPIASLEEPAIGLMLNSEAFYARTTTVLMRTNWYPFARAVGLYVMSHGGHPFVDVFALLVRPYPTLDQVFAPLPSGDAPGGLPGILDDVRQEISEEVDSLSNGNAALSRRYDKDYQFLYPLSFFFLCCQFNGVDWQSLQTRAPHVAQILEEYVASLCELKQVLRDLGFTSQILSQETDIKKLLPEPSDLW